MLEDRMRTWLKLSYRENLGNRYKLCCSKVCSIVQHDVGRITGMLVASGGSAASGVKLAKSRPCATS